MSKKKTIEISCLSAEVAALAETPTVSQLGFSPFIERTRVETQRDRTGHTVHWRLDLADQERARVMARIDALFKATQQQQEATRQQQEAGTGVDSNRTPWKPGCSSPKNFPLQSTFLFPSLVALRADQSIRWSKTV